MSVALPSAFTHTLKTCEGYVSTNADRYQKSKRELNMLANTIFGGGEDYKKFTTTNVFVIQLDGNYFVVDTDDQESDEFALKIMTKYGIVDNVTPSISNVFFGKKEKNHYWFQLPEHIRWRCVPNYCNPAFLNNGKKTHDLSHYDLLGSKNRIVFENKEYLHRLKNIPMLSQEMFDDFCSFVPKALLGDKLNFEPVAVRKTEPRKPIENIVVRDFGLPVEVKKFIDENTRAEDAGPYQSWSVVLTKIANKYGITPLGLKAAHYFSAKHEAYDKNGVTEFYNKIDLSKESIQEYKFWRIESNGKCIIQLDDDSLSAASTAVNSVVSTDTEEVEEKYGETDEDFSVIAYERLKNDYVYSEGQLFHKEGNIWTNDAKSFQSALRTSIIALKLKKKVVKEIKGGTITTEVLYCDMVKNLKNVCILTEDKIIENKDPTFYDKLHITTLGKLCFNDGVYDFRTKTFLEWKSEELKKNPVYSLVKINRKFPKSVDETFKNTCFDKIFNESMGKENAERWVAYLSRAIAGEIQDKLFATLQTNRDASKGVMNDWLMSAFGAYVKQAESKNFLIQRERSSGDAAKENAWLVDFQVVRLMLVQEFPLDMKNKGLKIDSKTIKSINSGGDKIEGRKNFKDAITFNIQSSSIFMVNDLPAYSSEDVLEKCIQITSTIQFKSEEYIANELKDAEGNPELFAFRKANLKKADPLIRLKVKQNDWADALVRILIDNYKDTPVVIPKALIEGQQDMRLDERVLSQYLLSGDTTHFVKNEDLREYAEECGCSLKKLKAQIIAMNGNITEGKHKEGTKDFKGLRGIKTRE